METRLTVITPSIRPQYLDLTQRCLEEQTYQDFEWLTQVGLRNRGFTLPSDFNMMLRRAKGDIIVILQDCITIPPDTLANIASLDHTKRAYTYPIQKEGGTYDWRKYRHVALGKDEITGNMWEIDLASAPRSLFFDVGGFDEEFNKGWSWENVEVAWRAAAAGYKFYCSQATEGTAIDHDKAIEHPYRNKRENNDKRANETARRAERGHFKLDYL